MANYSTNEVMDILLTLDELTTGIKELEELKYFPLLC